MGMSGFERLVQIRVDGYSMIMDSRDCQQSEGALLPPGRRKCIIGRVSIIPIHALVVVAMMFGYICR